MIKIRERMFVKITWWIPYYMVMTERRIPGNEYLDWDYRKRLSFEALECLKMGA